MSGIQDMVNSSITLHRNLNQRMKNAFLLYNGISEQDAQTISRQVAQLRGKWAY
jgi:hypothetical protein